METVERVEGVTDNGTGSTGGYTSYS